MPWKPGTGVSAQRLAAMIRNRIACKTVTPGEFINTGLDGGTEFSFLVKGRDGAEFIVSVMETKPCEERKPTAPSVRGPVEILPFLKKRADRQKEMEERGKVRRAEARETARLRSLERRRVKWLGG